MSQINWAAIRRIKAEPQTITLQDSRLEGGFVISLRKLDPLKFGEVADRTRELDKRYRSGGWINAAGEAMPFAEQIVIDGEEVAFSANSLFDLALVEAMQVGSDPHSFTDLVHCAFLLPEVYMDVVERAKVIQFTPSDTGKGSAN
jgi:hypothetical protein